MNKWKKWEVIRERGKLNYLLVNGALAWGVPIGILFTAIMSYWNHGGIEFNEELYRTLLISIVIFSLGGMLYGQWVWNVMEKEYRKKQHHLNERSGR